MARHAAATLALALLALQAISLAAADHALLTQPGSLCSGGSQAEEGWELILLPPPFFPGGDSALPSLLNATLTAFWEGSWQQQQGGVDDDDDAMEGATEAASDRVPCSQQEVEAALAGCSRALEDEQALEMVLWVNLSCPGGGPQDSVAASLRAYATLPLPLDPDSWVQDFADSLEVEALPTDMPDDDNSGASDSDISSDSDDDDTGDSNSDTGSDSDGTNSIGEPTGSGEEGPVGPRTTALPPPPAWVQGPEYRGPGEWQQYAIKQHARNREIVAAANASSTRWDLVLYGDSITRYIMREKDQWEELFSEANGWGPKQLLGVSGNEVADLGWRLGMGGELPALDPKIVAVLMGINDLSASNPVDQTAQRMGELLDWMALALPRSQLVLLALMPNADNDVAPLNARYAELAAQRGIPFLSCAQEIDPFDTDLLFDGTHPTPAAQLELLQCMEPGVRPLLATAS